MNSIIKTLLFLSFSVALLSCSDEFVNDKLTISGVAASAIIISPEWEAGDYQFTCPGLVKGDFTITGKPEWLRLDSNAGKFSDSIATVHGHAQAEPQFSEIGVYLDQMLVKAGGKQFAVPVYYITEGNPSAKVDHEFKMTTENYLNLLRISNTGNGILLWDIVSMPDWLTVDRSQFDPMSLIMGKSATAAVPFTYNVEAAMQNDLKGTIVLKTNDKNNPLIQIAVTLSLGTPDLHLMDQQLTLGSYETTKKTLLSNQGNGTLAWHFEGLPEWLSVTPASGITRAVTGYQDLTFTCNRTNLQAGVVTATFFLKSNDPDQPSVPVTVTIRVPGNGSNIKPVTGNIMDAVFDKTTNTLYYLTMQPNRLVAIDVASRTVVDSLTLTNNPTCLAMNENFTRALVGTERSINIVDLSTFRVSKTYPMNTAIYDVEWAINGWFCYTIANSYSSELLWINTTNDATYHTSPTPLFYDLGTARLKKVPHQPYIIASRTNVSPTGIYVFDLQTKTLKSYTHQSIGNFWFFNDGELIINGWSSILRSSELTAASGMQITDPSSHGLLKTDQGARITWWADVSETNHSIWALFSYYEIRYYPPVKGTIYQFNEMDYSLEKTYYYDYMYHPNAQTPAYEVEARYFFANSTATELTVLRKAQANNTWSIEFMPL